MTLISLCSIAVACTSVLPVSSGTEEAYWPPTDIVYEDHIYSATVRAVQFFKKGFDLAPPIIELGSMEPLVLRFDDLQPDPEQLMYTIVHCDAHWSPSDLMVNQFIAGSPTDLVPSAEQSYLTLQPFLQYTIELPNELMRPTIAGKIGRAHV